MFFQDESVDCKENFELLIPHQCRTAELKKQELAGRINQLNHDLEAVLNEDEISNESIQKIKMTNDKVRVDLNMRRISCGNRLLKL